MIICLCLGIFLIWPARHTDFILRYRIFSERDFNGSDDQNESIELALDSCLQFAAGVKVGTCLMNRGFSNCSCFITVYEIISFCIRSCSMIVHEMLTLVD